MAIGDKYPVVYVDGDVPQLPIQLGQLLVDSSQISPGVTNLQQCTSQVPLVYEPLQGGYPINAAEIAAGVTVVNDLYPWYWVDRYGTNAVPGTTDMTAAQLAAINACAAAGGGYVNFSYGSAYKIVTAPIVKQGVVLNLNQATITLAFPAGSDVVGYDLRDYSGIVNGTINATGNPTGLNAVHHCNILVGAADGSLTGYKQWRVTDLVLTNTRSDTVGGTCIFVAAASNNGIIENIYFPDSANLGACIRTHWQGNGVSPAPTASAHPNNIQIRNIRMGEMTKAYDADVAGIDIVGAYNIAVENVLCKQMKGSAVLQIRPGAFGSAVAPADVAPLVNRGISVRNLSCPLAEGYGILINGFAHGGGAIPAASYAIPALIQNVKTAGADSLATTGRSCLKTSFTSDCIFENIEGEKHYYGAYVEESSVRITVRNSKFYSNQSHGVAIVHATQPKEITIDSVECRDNDQANLGAAGFYVESATGVTFKDCIAGNATSEATQFYGFRVADTSDTVWQGVNRVRNVKGGGTRYDINGPATGNFRLCGGSAVALSTTTTEYWPVSGVAVSGASENAASILVSAPMVLTNLQGFLTTAPTGVGKLREIRIRVNGVASALDFNISNAATTGVDYSPVEVAAGDRIVIETLVANTPSASFAKWAVEGFLI